MRVYEAMMKVSVIVDVMSVQLYPLHLPTLNTRPPQRRCVSHILHLRMQGHQVETQHGPARAGAELSAFGSESSSSSARPHLHHVQISYIQQHFRSGLVRDTPQESLTLLSHLASRLTRLQLPAPFGAS